MKIKNTNEAREYIIEEVKRQIVGPGNGHFIKDIASFQFNPKNKDRHLQEVLDESPVNLYMAGILYPQKTLFENVEDNIEDNEEGFSEDEILKNDIERDIKKKELIDRDTKESEHDESKIDIDNNRDIDLTNDFKQSAIGLSALIKIPEKLKITVNDMGKYHRLTKDFPHELQIICLFLSKFSGDKKSYIWFKYNFSLEKIQRGLSIKFLENVFNVMSSRIKNVEDYFDKFFSNRKGWHQKNKVNAKYDHIHREYASKNFEEFSTIVKKYILLAQKNKENDEKLKKDLIEDQKGYSRESINSSLIFTKKELMEEKFLERFFTKDDGMIGLKASITVRPSKKAEDIKYLTIAIVNENKFEKKYSLDKLFFQSNFTVEDLDGKSIFENFEDVGLDQLDEEERSLYLLHHKRENFSIGHGCSVNWTLDKKTKKCISVYTEILPVTEVRPIKAKNLPNINLNMKIFSENLEYAYIQINDLINQYNKWLSDEKKYGENLSNSIFKEASSKNMAHCYKILDRIKEGLKILKTDQNIQEAFKLMNKAMYMQQAHYSIKPEQFSKNIEYEKILTQTERGNWFAFQICFILLNIKGITDPTSEDRNIVDLIWFPTGGGKTEAYLGLSSLVIFYRKLKYKDSNGTSVLMRYTLRLLTTQQFQRASTLICACENIRRNNQEKLGNIEISIGLWVGGDVTPNTIKDAKYNLAELSNSLEDDQNSISNKFIILKCPWCNTKMSANEYIISPKNKFLFVCSNETCDFSSNQESLPIKVIDSEIYETPPTLLIGTIDKFATLPWRVEAINAYDPEKIKNFLPPDLIIQDELHLISGPLGSIAGMYEIIINAITERVVDEKLIKAKIIGSTATISRANMQIQNLYGRSCSIFPPQANKLEDSFFAEEDNNPNVFGRKYVGIFTPSSNSLEVTLAQILSTLNLAGGYLKEYSEEKLDIYDPYWTNLIYFNSIRELMKGSSLIDSDANESIKHKWFRKGIMIPFLGDTKKYKNLRRKFDNDITELTSRVDSSQIPRQLEILELQADKQENLSACLATNMIQVGIDIGRLSLMTIVGQPKTTSEYIQASSRVGREKEKPGLVFTQLSHTKLRDRSHYEKFSSYHQNLYKYVEPTSVTSHSDPVRKRCLHAIVIFLVRFWSKKHREIPSIPSEDLIHRIKEYISSHVHQSDREHLDEVKKTEDEIDYIISRWASNTPEVYGSMGTSVTKTLKSVLMKPAGSEQKLEGNPFETPTSMRNVDRECAASLQRTEN